MTAATAATSGPARALAVGAPVALLVLLVLASAIPRAQPVDPATSLPGVESVVLWGELRDLPRGTLVLDAPVRSYSEAEVAAVRAFLDDGGRLAVVSPSASAQSLLRAVDAGIEPSGATAFDPDVDAAGRMLATGTGALGVSGDLRLASSRIVDGDGEALVATGPFTWRDEDRDGVPDLGEERGSFALARVRPTGDGDGGVLVLGTRALLEDGVAAAPLSDWLAHQPPLLLDGSHRQAADPLDARPVLSGHRDAGVAAALVLLGLAGLAIAFRLQAHRIAPRRRRRRLDPQALELMAELEP